MSVSSHRPIRILHWGMTSGLGGLETFLMNVYRTIDRDAVQFDFLVPHDERKLAFEDEIVDLGGNVYRVMYSRRESPVRALTCLPDFFKEHHDFAGMHVNANFPYALPLKYAQRAGIGMRILHSHSCIPDSFWAHDTPIKRVLRGFSMRSARHDIDTYPTHYLACSSLAAGYMFPGKPYTLMRNGIDTAVFAFDSQARLRLRAELGIPHPSTTVIGCCGALRSQKNPLFLVEVFAAYHRMNPDSMLLFVGDGEERKAIESRAAELGVTSSLHITGRRNDVADLYQAMDAFVLPSLFEGLGIVYIEAQCAGLPSLASSDVVPAEVKVTDLLRFVPLEQSAQRWAEELDRAVRQAGTREGYASQVRAAGYDMQDVVGQLQEYYVTHADGAR